MVFMTSSLSAQVMSTNRSVAYSQIAEAEKAEKREKKREEREERIEGRIKAIEGEGLRIGLRMGGTHSWIRDKHYSGATYRLTNLGFNLGITADYELFDRFSLYSELLFAVTADDYIFTTDQNSVYIDDFLAFNVPIMAKYRITNGLYLSAGAQLGFGLTNFSDAYDEVSGSYTDISNAFNLSLAADLQYYITKSLNVNLRYTHGLTSVIERNDYIYPVKPRGLQFGFGYTLFRKLSESDRADNREERENKKLRNSNFSVGFRVSYLNSWVKGLCEGDATEECLSRSGFNIGFAADYKLSDRFGVASELTLKCVLDPFRYESDELDIRVAEYMSFKIPILAKYKLLDRLYLGVGPQLEFSFDNHGSVYYDDDKSYYSESDLVKLFSLSLAADAQYYITKSLNVNLRYTHALTSIIKENDYSDPIKPRGLQFGIGYTLFRK